MSVVETVLVYVLIPLGIYAVVALLTLRERFAKVPRYRPGQPWNYPPVWWAANASGSTPRTDAPAGSGGSGQTAKGGARGGW